MFGVPLTESLSVSKIAELPAVVYRCIEYLEAKHAELEEGIYRLSGSSAVIKGLRDRFNTGQSGLTDNQPHSVACTTDPARLISVFRGRRRSSPRRRDLGSSRHLRRAQGGCSRSSWIGLKWKRLTVS